MADFSPVELLELFQRAQAQFTDRVDAVAPDQWEDEALPGWTVADLVAHLVTEQLWVPPLLAGEPVLEGRFPERVIQKAVERMLPGGPLSRKQMGNLRVYGGAEHPHTAQQPQALEI